MIENVNLIATLMYQEHSIAKFKLEFMNNIIFISDVLMLNKQLLPPYYINYEDDELKIRDFLLSRLISSHTRYYIQIVPIILFFCSKRVPMSNLLFSLETNCASLTDAYWINPDRNYEFVVCNRTLKCQVSNWEHIKRNKFDLDGETSLNNVLFNDMLMASNETPIYSLKNPVFTTNGDEQKRWILLDNKWCLEKRNTKEKIQKELECFDFFKKRDIIVPQTRTYKLSVSNKKQYLNSTIEDGLNIILKQTILHEKDTLIPLSWCLLSIKTDIITKSDFASTMLEKVSEDVLNNFIEAINLYKKTYQYDHIDLSNIGFVCSDGKYLPSVWSNIGYMNDPLCMIGNLDLDLKTHLPLKGIGAMW